MSIAQTKLNNLHPSFISLTPQQIISKTESSLPTKDSLWQSCPQFKKQEISLSESPPVAMFLTHSQLASLGSGQTPKNNNNLRTLDKLDKVSEKSEEQLSSAQLERCGQGTLNIDKLSLAQSINRPSLDYNADFQFKRIDCQNEGQQLMGLGNKGQLQFERMDSVNSQFGNERLKYSTLEQLVFEKEDELAKLKKEFAQYKKKSLESYLQIEFDYNQIQDDYSRLNEENGELRNQCEEKEKSIRYLNDQLSQINSALNSIVTSNDSKPVLEKIAQISEMIKNGDQQSMFKEIKDEISQLKQLRSQLSSDFGKLLLSNKSLDSDKQIDSLNKQILTLKQEKLDLQQSFLLKEKRLQQELKKKDESIALLEKKESKLSSKSSTNTKQFYQDCLERSKLLFEKNQQLLKELKKNNSLFSPVSHEKINSSNTSPQIKDLKKMTSPNSLMSFSMY